MTRTVNDMVSDIVLSTGWILGVIAGAGGVIAFLFRALIVSKDAELARLKADFDLFREQVEKDDARRAKEDGQIKILIDMVHRLKK